MDPITGAAFIGGAATLGSSLLGSGSSAKALAWNKKAQKITWQREDNAVQRRVADLKAAGMSPLLAAGAGAQSSPAAHIGSQDMPDIGSAVNGAIATKLAMTKQKADITQTEAQTKLLMGNLATVQKQNALLQQTLDWYKNHPESAPNVPGQGTVNTAKSFFDWIGSTITDSSSSLAGRVGSRLGEWIGEKYYNWTHPNRPKWRNQK